MALCPYAIWSLTYGYAIRLKPKLLRSKIAKLIPRSKANFSIWLNLCITASPPSRNIPLLYKFSVAFCLIFYCYDITCRGISLCQDALILLKYSLLVLIIVFIFQSSHHNLAPLKLMFDCLIILRLCKFFLGNLSIYLR